MTPTDPTEESAGGHVVLGGKYVLGDILGTGGTYTVYEASRLPSAPDEAAPADGSPGPELLVKVLHPHLVDDDATRASLAREIAASDRVDHPGVAKVLDTGEDEVAGANVPWLLMRRLPGVPLSDLASGQGLPWPDALAVVGGLLDALGAVHDAGLVHRDVSPRNVVIDSRDDGSMTVGLLDLGLAAPGGGDGDGERVAGSAAYMSPEQAQGKPLDARSDLYSVGALAYFALTGHPPFERSRPADVLRAHVQAPVPAPSARRAAVPAAVDRFVARAMAKNPARRFASAGATGAAVAALLGTSAPAGAGGTVGVGGTAALDAAGPDQTMPLGQVPADDDPHRTAAIGTAAAAAAAAAAAEDAELQRTRQLGAVDALGATVAVPGPGDEPPTDGPTDGSPVEDDSERSRWSAFFGSPRRTALVVILLVLLVAAGAGAFWLLRDDDGGRPVAPVTNSPSPSPTRTTQEPRETDPPDDQTDDPTYRPAPTEDPTPTETSTPDPTPTETSTPDPTPTETSTPDPTPTETSTPDPTPTETSTPDPTPTETSTPDPTPTEEPPPVETTPPGDGDGGADTSQ
ncbi:serine/threonine-protein kinase [Isoptericola cucumis]|uniref:Protein kinase domain-containing protein n=2 Tax=Isoptericola cucumis TaxID=1776856 RepID=A0ABQ2B5P3_9MICO|nr:serine/threonine-protein kinase [Isoptericola cucumis]GGI06633.1 hypothetical protein GCM10007368_12140 [Isoptericola cucumis]